MYVGANGNTWSSVEHYRAMLAAKVGAPDTGTKASSDPVSAAVEGAAKPSADNAVTGSTGSNLAAETMASLIESVQQEEDVEGGYQLPIGTQHGLDDIANDPVYAARRAKEMGTYPNILPIKAEDMPKNGDPDSVWVAFAKKMEVRMALTEQVDKERTAYYESMMAEGLPPAEIVARLLEFNASLSERFDIYKEADANMSWSAFHSASHDYLRQAMGQAGVKETDDIVASEAQKSEETAKPDTSKFDALNQWSESDRKLLSSMTGYTVDEHGRFFDKDGNAGFPEDLTNHSLRSFLMSVQSARNGSPEGAIAGQHITTTEFRQLMNNARAGAASMGEKFNEEFFEKGLAYLEGLNSKQAT